MASRKIHDLCVSVGKYNGSDGKEKNRYQTVGVMMETDAGGRFILLEPWFNPAGIAHDPGKSIMISLFDPKPHDGAGQSAPPPASSSAPASPPTAPGNPDDIPF